MIIAPPQAEHVGPTPFGRGYASMFAPEKLTLGVYFPIEAFGGPEPAMVDQIQLAQQAERLGFSALWARDVPLNDPNFGDLGQLYDPFVWLATIATRTSSIALATGAVILPLHHPIDVAKAAASLDQPPPFPSAAPLRRTHPRSGTGVGAQPLLLPGKHTNQGCDADGAPSLCCATL